MDIEEQGIPYRMTNKDKCLRYLRKFIQWLFSYVGLTAILVGYLFLGAIVFKAIEGPEEVRLKDEIRKMKDEMITTMYDGIQGRNDSDWKVFALIQFEEFEKNTNQGSIRTGDDHVKWSFFGSMLFSLTVVTTIGYGHIAPITTHGQVICILYALIGIPLMLLVLTNVGRVLANTARLLFKMYSSNLCKKVRCQDKRRKASQRKKSLKRKKSQMKRNNTISKRSSVKKLPTFSGGSADEKYDHLDEKKDNVVGINSNNINSADIFAALYCECNAVQIEERILSDRVESYKENDSTLRDVSSTNLSCSSDDVFETNYDEPINEFNTHDNSPSVINEQVDGSDKSPNTTPCLLKTMQFEENSAKEIMTDTSRITFASLEDSFLHTYPRPMSCSSLTAPTADTSDVVEQRRCSCVDFREFDKSQVEVGDSHGKETLHYSLKRRRKDTMKQGFLRKTASRKMTRSESLPIIERSSSRKQNKDKFNSLRMKRKTKLHSGLAHPTLSSLLQPVEMKIQDTATAIRLATYCKRHGSSREDLTTGISEVSDEDTRLLDWTDSMCSRRQLLSSSSVASFNSSQRKRKISKKKHKSSEMSQDLSDIAENDSDDNDETKQRTITEADIPITPVLIFFFSYVLLGALMFFMLETGWNVPTAIYFCFITLTTIGFGDYVPDSSLSSLIACCIYTAVGMAITSMCIALIMKKFVLQVKRLGRKIGLLKDEVDV